MELTDNLNIKQFKPLTTPEQLKADLPITESAAALVADSRRQIENILRRQDKRRMVIVGPCSLHDLEATFDFARRLQKVQKECSELLLVMRAYFEKPRTTLGWKGMLYDPHLDGSYDIDFGIRQSRRILCELAAIGVPAATEFLDPIVPQYLADLISWAAIGARTAESQIHRQMASGLSMPIGFKNSTDGKLSVALDAIQSAQNPHSFLGIDRNGKVIVAETRGNKYGHLVMRGGSDGPNYACEYVAFAEALLRKNHILNGIVIDCSHANSHKNHKRQREALLDIADQIKNGNISIAGVMLESFIKEGKQSIGAAGGLKYGVSLTDSCIGWEETEELIKVLAEAVRNSDDTPLTV
ncbi:MAG TPA: 3-deoxy-7-phosphoheptulonate synthase [Anaerohalosphaeraceae bacterium]|nr:3-deoxy-7-phosphoheptulonate synthase [Phycisphaerae bacterium]HOK96761.1 3-deoxy-7-phosphoheptulonate synthase [Anaerohalosphaeraceae bacterium]HOL30449.1 3-deoxy-7-phosphoheptulonate synthase [Anaerohalosphaeraceae bacterium]HOM76762.1 3-deoxy-7-phosphoheptulonate synthase [Anaerohalosphaeraceae bacterium]HPC64082.1 3-deoxy-7-phosphoheptulonate synthase [Anaerohalosphaeraceae bacterium]